MKKYKVFVNGAYVGSTDLTPAEVSKLNNDNSIILRWWQATTLHNNFIYMKEVVHYEEHKHFINQFLCK